MDQGHERGCIQRYHLSLLRENRTFIIVKERKEQREREREKIKLSNLLVTVIKRDRRLIKVINTIVRTYPFLQSQSRISVRLSSYNKKRNWIEARDANFLTFARSIVTITTREYKARFAFARNVNDKWAVCLRNAILCVLRELTANEVLQNRCRR